MYRTLRLVVLIGLLVGLSAPAMASPFTVTLDTSSLAGPQLLAFGLVDGDGAVDNAITLSGFDFGGGSATAGTDDCTFGGALSGLGCSGDLTSAVVLDDSDSIAVFTQQFTPGSSISFVLDTSNNIAGVTPDAFAMYVCDLSLNCYSDDAATGAMLVLNLTGQALSLSDFILNAATEQGLPAPVVSDPAAVPEPATLLLVGTGLAAVASRRRGSRK